MRGDTSASIEFLRLFYPDGPWLLTAIQTDRKAIETRTFGPETEDGAVAWLNEYNGLRNIYFSVNPPTRELNKKAERGDIKELAWLHVDLDPRAGEDVDAERERILRVLEDPPGGLPPATCIIFSGGGYQAFWKLADPMPINGEAEAYEEAKRYNQQIELLLNADNCHNVDRIMRVPGTINVPDAIKKRKGRKKILSTLHLFEKERVYPLGDFNLLPKVQMADDGIGARPGAIVVSGNVERLTDVDELDDWGVPERVKVIIVQGHDPDNPKEHDNSRSAWLFDCLCQLFRAEVPEDTIYSVITDPDFGISSSVIDKGSNMEKYALRQMTRAKEEADDPMLRMLNERFAVIGNWGGKCRVIEEQYDHAMHRTRLTKQSFEDFRNRFMNQLVQTVSADGKPMFKPAGKWWLEHRQRRQFDSLVFVPGREIAGAYNLWKGFACESLPGECDLFLGHLKNIVCDRDEEHYEYLLGWMATAVQQPDRQGEICVVLRGRQGTGKGFFAKAFGSLWGRHFLQVSDPKHLVGNFNSHLRDCVVLFADEAFFAGDKKHESILKTLITEETIIVEPKGIDAEAAPNYVHLIMASNSDWVVPANADDRRFFVLDVANDEMQNSAYFASIYKQLEEGGREGLLHMLMTRDISDFNVRDAPKTKALQDQKIYSMAVEEEWWFRKLQDGKLLSAHDNWEEEIQCEDLIADYVAYTRSFNLTRRGNATLVGKFLKKACPKLKRYQRRAKVRIMTNDGFEVEKYMRPYFYRVMPLKEMRATWDDLFGSMGDWPDEPEKQEEADLGEKPY